jgi:hypothetical protein
MTTKTLGFILDGFTMAEQACFKQEVFDKLKPNDGLAIRMDTFSSEVRGGWQWSAFFAEQTTTLVLVSMRRSPEFERYVAVMMSDAQRREATWVVTADASFAPVRPKDGLVTYVVSYYSPAKLHEKILARVQHFLD